MMKQHPIVIYDGNTWEGLRQRGFAPGYHGYRAHFNSWFMFFDDPDSQKGLDEALSWLPESATARGIVEAGKTDVAGVRTLVLDPLMRNRVADVRLFYEGGGFL